MKHLHIGQKQTSKTSNNNLNERIEKMSFPISIETLRSNYQYHNTVKELSHSTIPSLYKGLSENPKAGTKREFCAYAVVVFKIHRNYVMYLCEQHNKFSEQNQINVPSVLKTYDAYLRKVLRGLKNTDTQFHRSIRKSEVYSK